MPRLTRLFLLAALAAAPACVDRPVSQVDPSPTQVSNLEFDVHPDPKLDLLFVIDNSNSMKNEQDEITSSFKQMIDVLETLPTGLPSIHIGVVATDVGAGTACAAPFPGPGILRNQAMVPGCSPPTDRWISDTVDASGQRVRNYTGALDDTFKCIASLGIHGCGFEQPLEAVRLALAPENTANAGFLRPDSVLAVVILSDEDDCSSSDLSFFEAGTPAGINGDFRCFAASADCGVDPTTPGTRAQCTVKDTGPLTPVDQYVDVLRRLRPLGSKLLVAGILGDHDPIRVGTNDQGEIDTLTSCRESPTDLEGAYPPLRTDAFLHAFGSPIRERICDPDLTPAIVDIGKAMFHRFYAACLPPHAADDNPDAPGTQPDCAVSEVDHPGTSDQTEHVLPACDAPVPDDATNKPCWGTVVDPLCADSPDDLRIAAAYPNGADTSPDAVIRAQCLIE